MKTKEDCAEPQINVELNKIAEKYGAKFIAERTGFYLIEYANDCDGSISIAFTLKKIRSSLLSFFNLPHASNTFQDSHMYDKYGNEDNCFVRCLLDVHTLLTHFILEMKDEEESEANIIRKDIDFLLDVHTAIANECDRIGKYGNPPYT